ncbi:CLUMA_CG017459, isoform A [Clunio marinus]|uniref:glutathione transferase n=1 Tax=Clunio marinus TaxID=568069 RepID=A0A1J1IYX6_9DIPT|nr:CLUMA_CG017459, isoform A [Clunio marinus]
MKFYYDLMSQPSRALYIFFKLNPNIPVTFIPVALRKGEHLEDAFKAINRFQKVPCIIDDDGWKLSETVAIFRYLNDKYQINEHWYPKDIRTRALVDEYMEWQHNNTRMGCAMYFQVKWLIPMMSGNPPSESRLNFAKTHMENVLTLLENTWLESSEKSFLTTKEISFADILAACELEQPKMADYDPFEGRPRLSSWYQKVKQFTNPFYDEAHALVNKIVNSNKNKPKL